MEWISVKDRLPDIDITDDWNKLHKISITVLAYSKDYGMRFGTYFYHSEFWTINNVHSSNGVEVTHWMPLPTPPNKGGDDE